MIEKKFIEENMKKIKLTEYFKSELDKAGFMGFEINKTPLVTRLVLKVTRPGLAIGKGGKNIKFLTEEIKEKFNIENPQIEIDEIKEPELNAKANISRIINLLERGYSWRSIVYKTVENIMAAGAQGTELIIKGKLTGKGGRKAKQRIAKGYLKKVGAQTELVDYAKGTAYPKAGAIGIKLRIIKPGVLFPDKVQIKEFLENKKKTIDKTKKPEATETTKKEKTTEKKRKKETTKVKSAGKNAKKETKKPEKKDKKPIKKSENLKKIKLKKQKKETKKKSEKK